MFALCCSAEDSAVMTERMLATENPYIEDVLEKYCSIPNLTMMALGSSYWEPPAAALQSLQSDLSKLIFEGAFLIGQVTVPSNERNFVPSLNDNMQMREESTDTVTSWAAPR